MRTAWSTLHKAVSEINTFRLLYTDSEDELGEDTLRSIACSNGDIYSECLEMSETPARSPLHLENSLVLSESLGSSHGISTKTDNNIQASNIHGTDALRHFTAPTLSEYISDKNPASYGTIEDNSLKPSFIPKHSDKDSQKESESNAETYSENIPDRKTDSAFPIASNRIDILYIMSVKLQYLWDEILPIVKERSKYKDYSLTLKKPHVWEKGIGLYDGHTEEIFRWIETSSNILYGLANSLNIEHGDISESTGSELLQRAVDTTYSSLAFCNDISKVWENPSAYGEQTPKSMRSEYIKLIRFITQLQLDYEERIDKLQIERDNALIKADSARALEAEVNAMKNTISILEAELLAKKSDIDELNESLQNANAAQLQIIQENERLIAYNKRLLIERGVFLNEGSVAQFLKQHHESDASGVRIKDETKKLLKDALETDTSDQTVTRKGKDAIDGPSLVEQFIKFLESDLQSNNDKK